MKQNMIFTKTPKSMIIKIRQKAIRPLCKKPNKAHIKQQDAGFANYCPYRLLLLIGIVCWSGCSDKFLNEEPVLKGRLGEPIHVEEHNGDLQYLALEIQEVQNADFQIRQFPKWMEFQHMEGHFSEGKAMIYFRIIPEILIQFTNKAGNLIINIKGFGLVLMDIVVGENPAVIYIHPNTLDFKTEISELFFFMQSQSIGPVTWNVTDHPDWILLERKNGLLSAYENYFMPVKCIRTNLARGTYTGRITLEFEQQNGSKNTYTISVSTEVIEFVNPPDLIAIEGSVVDAAYCKQSDRLFIATKNPDRVLVYRNNECISEILLNKAPNCLAISENEQQLLIGHSGLISSIDGATLQVQKSFELDFNVFDLVYGENDWVYLSPDADYVREAIIYLNLTTGKLLRIGSTQCSGKTNFHKIKGKPVLLCSRENVSPAGIILFDISDVTPVQKNYWHEDYGNKIWFSENHKYAYGSRGYVFTVPDFNTGPDLLPLGRLGESINALGIDHSASTNSIWLAVDNWWEEDAYVNRFDADDYKLIASFKTGKYATSINGVSDYYKTLPHYVFTDKAGKHVYIIKNVFINYSEKVNAWSIETLTLD